MIYFVWDFQGVKILKDFAEMPLAPATEKHHNVGRIFFKLCALWIVAIQETEGVFFDAHTARVANFV